MSEPYLAMICAMLRMTTFLLSESGRRGKVHAPAWVASVSTSFIKGGREKGPFAIGDVDFCDAFRRQAISIDFPRRARRPAGSEATATATATAGRQRQQRHLWRLPPGPKGGDRHFHRARRSRGRVRTNCTRRPNARLDVLP